MMRAKIIILIFLIPILTLNACAQPGAAGPSSQEGTSGTPQPAGLARFEGVSFVLDPAVADKAAGSVVPANPGNADAPYWEVHPEYVRLSLAGYPYEQAYIEPVIAVYPVESYRQLSDVAAETLDRLQLTLDEHPGGQEPIPSLPLNNAGQFFRSNLKFLDFQNGRGVRFLAVYSQAADPVTNAGLVYSYQGLTDDGQQAVSIFLPVSHPSLPASPDRLTPQEIEVIYSDYAGYMAGVFDNLLTQPDDSFTPGLDKLDALVSSLKVERSGGGQQD